MLGSMNAGFVLVVILIAALLHHPSMTVLADGGEKRSLSKCDRECRNGGECRLGFTGTADSASASASTSGQEGRPYCHCPLGYSGNFCEIKFVVCSEGQTGTCFNDSPCIRDVDADGTTYYHCQCDIEGSDFSAPYAIRFCEHAASTFCKPKDNHNSLGPTGDSYCANSGKCKPPETGKHHAGCTCATGWTGIYCERPANAPVPEQLPPSKSNSAATTKAQDKKAAAASARYNRFKRFLLATLGFTILFISLAVVALLVEHGTSGQRRARTIRYSHQRQNNDEEEDEEDDDDVESTGLKEQEMTPSPPRGRSKPNENGLTTSRGGNPRAKR